MALSAERNTTRMNPDPVVGILEPPLGAGKKVYLGGLVAVNAGYAEAASTALNLIAVGVAEATVDNTGGAAGDKRVRCKRGTFRFKNSAADAVTQADLLKDCYIVDDETVAKTDGSGTRSKAGRVMGIDAAGVFVEIL